MVALNALEEESLDTSAPNLKVLQTAMLHQLDQNPLGRPQSPHSPKWGCPTVNHPNSNHHTTP